MKILIEFFRFFLFLLAFNIVVFSQNSINVKTSGIKSGILIPVGDLSKSNGVGFMVSDLTKWSISKFVKVLGRLEVAVYDGKKIENKIMVGYDYQHNVAIYNTYEETTNPMGIITAGSGFEFSFGSKGGGFYTILDFPSINVIAGAVSNLRVGMGVGLGYEFSWNKSLFGLELRGNIYNAFLTQSGEKALGGIHFGFEVEL